MDLLKENLVKSCPKLESGLRLGWEGLHACQLGPFSSPIFWIAADELVNLRITREMIAQKRKWIFAPLNDYNGDTPCLYCSQDGTALEIEFSGKSVEKPADLEAVGRLGILHKMIETTVIL